MHGLINKAIETFLGDTYGDGAWTDILHAAELWDQIGTDGFDLLHVYPESVTRRLLAAAAAQLGRPRDCLLEDLGTYLVSHPRTDQVRRLLRFGGRSYPDFLRSLDDLQGRARLALPNLDLPALSLADTEPGRYRLTCHACPDGFCLVMLGLVRAMADEYGALVVLEHLGRTAPDGAASADVAEAESPDECLSITVHDSAFYTARSFTLSVSGG